MGVRICFAGVCSICEQYLLESGQEAKAGAVKEKEGDYRAAINLYLKVRFGVPCRHACPWGGGALFLNARKVQECVYECEEGVKLEHRNEVHAFAPASDSFPPARHALGE